MQISTIVGVVQVIRASFVLDETNLIAVTRTLKLVSVR
jgi:hypothetical protein